MSRRPHSYTNKRNQPTSRNMGNFFSAEEQATVKSSKPLASAHFDVIKDYSVEIGSDCIETFNSLVDYHKKVAEQISRLEKDLSELKETYKHHDDIILTAECITIRIIQKQQEHKNSTGSQGTIMTNMQDDGMQSLHENDHIANVETSLKMDDLRRDKPKFQVLIQDLETLLSDMESEVNKHGDKIKKHEESINLLKEQYKQRKLNIRTQRVHIKALQNDFKMYEKRLQQREYINVKEVSQKRTQNYKPSPPITRQSTKETNKQEDGEQRVHNIDHNMTAPPETVQKKTRKYAFALNKELTQEFQSMKSEKLGFFNLTTGQSYFDEFLNILKEEVIGMHEYSPIEGITAFDRILVFGTCTMRVEGDSNMALDKIPKEHRSKVVLVMFHKTAGSKTPEEVYMYSFKHADVIRELHIPFKSNC